MKNVTPILNFLRTKMCLGFGAQTVLQQKIPILSGFFVYRIFTEY